MARCKLQLQPAWALIKFQNASNLIYLWHPEAGGPSCSCSKARACFTCLSPAILAARVQAAQNTKKGHVRNEHQHVRSAGGSSDNVSGLKFPDSPSCATTQPSFVSCLPRPLKLLAKTFTVVVAVVAAAVTCVASVSVFVCLCVEGRQGALVLLKEHVQPA